MTDNVVQLRKPEEPRIWVCGHCGNTGFLLFEDGSTECKLCGFHDHEPRGRWVEHVIEDKSYDLPERDITDYATIDLAREAVLRSADRDTNVIVVIWPSGRLRVWSRFDHTDSDERKEWLRETLGAAAGLALGKPTGTRECPE